MDSAISLCRALDLTLRCLFVTLNWRKGSATTTHPTFVNHTHEDDENGILERYNIPCARLTAIVNGLKGCPVPFNLWVACFVLLDIYSAENSGIFEDLCPSGSLGTTSLILCSEILYRLP